MNEKEFLQKLSEVAEWHRPQTGPSGQASVRKGHNYEKVPKPEDITEEELELMSDEAVEDYYKRLMRWRETQPNNSIAPEITKIKAQKHECEDCGKQLDESRHVICKKHESGGPHWRKRCMNCGFYKNPLTGRYEITTNNAHHFFIQLYKPKKGAYNSKFQPNVRPKEPVLSEKVEVQVLKDKIREYVVVETEKSIIRTFQSESADKDL